MKVYIAGKITGLPNYREVFAEKEKELIAEGHTVMNPAVLPYPGFEHHEYMHICKAMIDVCDLVLFMKNAKESAGAKEEMSYAAKAGKAMWFDVLTEDMEQRLFEGNSPLDKKCEGILGGLNHEET